MKKMIVCFLILLFIGSKQFDTGETVRVLESYPLDDSLFIQGFELYNEEQLLISSGRYEESKTLLYNLESHSLDTIDNLPDNLFAEGITVAKDTVWQLTWQENIAIKRDAKDLSLKEYIPFDREGWGIAYDTIEDTVWTSDGSSQVTKRNRNTLAPLATIVIHNQEQTIDKINELEFVDGYLYANIFQRSEIIKIDSSTGAVVGQWDIQPLIDEIAFEDLDPERVLNGIAHYKENQFFITGKRFPKIWLVELK